MSRYSWQVLLAFILLLLSVGLYWLHYLIFRNANELLLWLLGSLAFLPISVLFVTIIINELLSLRERRSRLQKLNMAIGAFFSEAGTALLTYFSDCDPNLDNIRNYLLINNNWTESQFHRVSQELRKYSYTVDINRIDLGYLRSFLAAKRDFLLRLLENPSLLEHETFTDLLRAVFHLTEELAARTDLTNLPDTDCAHLASDTERAYVLMVGEWLDYMKYLKGSYPYLFSLAIRLNPFDQNASPIVR